MSESEKKFLSLQELADRWGFKKKSLYPWVQSGKLSFATKLGGEWRFPIRAVEKYEKSNTVETR